jgi:peptidyl-prolyl cis-trans isomerase D
MALIGKIRQNFWLVLIVLGLALASFVLMDVMGSNSGGGMFNQTTVGEVDGDKIDYTEFSRVENALFSSMNDPYARKNTVWNYLVEKSLVEKNAEALGLGVSQEELMDLQFGNNLSPVIQNNFRNPQTGAVDRQQLLEIKQAIEKGEGLNQQFREFWANQEIQIVKTATQDKITNLISKAIYTPSWMTELTGKFNTETATFEYVKVPFSKIPDAEVTLEDSDYTSYIDENGNRYISEEESRLVDYVVFDVLPTKADSNKIFEQVNDLKERFEQTTEDSLFAINNSGVYSYIYNSVDELQGIIKDQVVNMNSGDVYGPYLENGFYQLTKVVDKAIVPDSVKARHILRTATPGDEASFTAAEKVIDSLMTAYNQGSQFDSLAIKHSQDPGSGFKGGELGTFQQGFMLPEFNNVCFVGSKKGEVYKVRTQVGYHLIEIQDLVFLDNEPKYKMAAVGSPVIPSEETQYAMNDIATELMRNNRTVESLTKAVEESNDFVLNTSKPLYINDYIFGDLGSGDESRAIVKWAFDAAPGEVSPVVYSFTDPVNYFDKNYVVVGLKSIQPPGKMTVAEAKSSIAKLVRDAKKGAMIKEQITGNNLQDIANQFGTVVDTALSVSFNSGFIPGAGSEPALVASMFSSNQGDIVGPLVGKTGVYIAKVTSITPAVTTQNTPTLKRTITSASRGQVNFRFWDAFKKKVNPEDNRAKFF